MKQNVKYGSIIRKDVQSPGADIILRGSLTVEAAVVVSIVLITIASMLLLEFRLHDRLAADTALYYALECYSYRNADTETIEEIRQAANADYHYILNGHPTVALTAGVLPYGVSGKTVSGKTGRELDTIHFRTETFLRASSLLELKNAIGNSAKKKAENGGGKQ